MDFKKEFHLYTEASGIHLGAALMQKEERSKQKFSRNASRVLDNTELNYLTTHNEALAVVWSLRNFRHILHGYAMHIRTDHTAVA